MLTREATYEDYGFSEDEEDGSYSAIKTVFMPQTLFALT